MVVLVRVGDYEGNHDLGVERVLRTAGEVAADVEPELIAAGLEPIGAKLRNSTVGIGLPRTEMSSIAMSFEYDGNAGRGLAG